MVWSQDDPATEAVAKIDDSHAAAEANNIWKGCSQGHNQDLWKGVRVKKRIVFFILVILR